VKIFLNYTALGILLLSSSGGIAESPLSPPNENTPAMLSKIENAIPVLPVRDLARSVDFYTNKLGFKLDWGDPKQDQVCSVSRDGRPIMLQVRENIATPGWVWIGADVALFEIFREAGVKVFQEPKNFSWAYEMKFEDVDGNILWLGSDPRRDLPFEDAKKE
jgi:catechol 2,3-dioxygenase-like lactoylglutathione lyase family enzyme